MNTLYCGQKGCEFEADKQPKKCPICGNPFHAHPNPNSLHAVAEPEAIEENNAPVDDGELIEDQALADEADADTENASETEPEPEIAPVTVKPKRKR